MNNATVEFTNQKNWNEQNYSIVYKKEWLESTVWLQWATVQFDLQIRKLEISNTSIWNTKQNNWNEQHYSLIYKTELLESTVFLMSALSNSTVRQKKMQWAAPLFYLQNKVVAISNRAFSYQSRIHWFSNIASIIFQLQSISLKPRKTFNSRCKTTLLQNLTIIKQISPEYVNIFHV